LKGFLNSPGLLLVNGTVVLYQISSKDALGSFKPPLHNSNLAACQKFLFDISKGQSLYVLTHLKGVFIKETSKINKICSIAGQIKSFRGLYVVHACFKLLGGL